jgi:hypothetical protein
VPGGPPKFAIGNDVQSDLLLARHRTSDRVVLDSAQLGGRDATRPDSIASLEQLSGS